MSLIQFLSFSHSSATISQDYKECEDAEGLLPSNTSDIQRTICSELHSLRAIKKLAQLDAKTRAKLGVTSAPPFDNIETSRKINVSSAAAASLANNDITSMSSCTNATLRAKQLKDARMKHNNVDSSAAVITPCTESNSNFVSIPTSSSINYSSAAANNTSADLASVDSTDTFMSCQTHPFLSQGDLADEHKFNLDDLNAESLYMNSMEFSGIDNMYKYGVNKKLDSRSVQDKIKKSCSGDVGTKAHHPTNQMMEDFFSGSHVSLDESPKPKHQKTRLSQQKQQQLTNNNLRGKVSYDDAKETSTRGGYESGSSTDRSSNTVVSDEMNSTAKKSRKSSILHPSKMITNATKQLINQHLFGLQSKGLWKFVRELCDSFDV